MSEVKKFRKKPVVIEAMQLGIPERSSSIVGQWFRKQGIFRKDKR